MSRYDVHPRSTRSHLVGHYGNGPWLQVGEHTYGLPTIIEPGTANLRIGNYCSLADDLVIILAMLARNVSTYPFSGLPMVWERREPVSPMIEPIAIEVGPDVTIGYRSILMPGASIGAGSMIGTGSVVTGVLPPYCVAVGAPARAIRLRCSEAERDALLDIAWWDWPEDVIAERLPDIQNPDIAGFVGRYCGERVGRPGAVAQN